MARRVLLAGTSDRAGYLKAYADALLQAGVEPVLAWPDRVALAGRRSLGAFISGFSGLLLPGGKDVEPWRYGEEPHPSLGPTDSVLDEGELALARAALALEIPTLAICRGIQVLGVAVGARLFQDLPSQRPGPIGHQVRTSQTILAHYVEVHPASTLARAVGSTVYQVNSRHHQAVRAEDGDRVGPLRVVARATDGVAEALELPDHRFFVGVQWHPENLVGERPEAKRLFAAFAEAART